MSREGSSLSLLDPVRYVKGIGPKKGAALGSLGIETAGDLLNHFPFRIEDYSRVVPIGEAEPGHRVTVKGIVTSTQFVGTARGGAFKAEVTDGRGILYLVWYNAPYMSGNVSAGMPITASGTVSWRRGGMEMAHPIYTVQGDEGDAGPIIPIYHATGGMSSKTIHSLIHNALPRYLHLLGGSLPKNVMDRHGLMSKRQAYVQIHDPPSQEAWEEARRTLAFGEMLRMQIGLQSMKLQAAITPGPAPYDRYKEARDFLDSLPFTLTSAQEKAVSDIAHDTSGGRTMNRLLQGDVGSGKTVVAMYGLVLAVKNGWQGAFLAPTEILAKQHYETFSRIGPPGVRTAFLSGGTPRKERDGILQGLPSGELDILIGTHALLNPEIKWKNLGFVVTDEQHRFGVKQRLWLQDSAGWSPHILVMSATPIPRSLALTLYGDLDISVIDSMPPGRSPVATKRLGERQRESAYRAVLSEVQAGRQAFVVCPVIEEGVANKKSAVKVFEELGRTYLRGVSLGLVHGGLPKGEIEAAMERFLAGETQVLVSTTVIEVGIDVPNATVMVVEDAGSFGLATLHQLRGRVGRGTHPARCFFIDSGGNSKRLGYLEKTSDGFLVAEYDLGERGPGQFFGTEQHGPSSMGLGDLGPTVEVLLAARDEAKSMVSSVYAGTAPEEVKRLVTLVTKTFGDPSVHSRSR